MIFLVCILAYAFDRGRFDVLEGNKCCTTCRIFNWDHLMMFTPMLFVKGFSSYSLILVAISVFAVWEICVFFVS